MHKYTYEQLLLIGLKQWEIIAGRMLILHKINSDNFNAEDIKDVACLDAIAHVLAIPEAEAHLYDLKSSCACCHYIQQFAGIEPGYGQDGHAECASICFLKELWPAGCEDEESPYFKYIYALSENEDYLEAARYALQIMEAFKAKWEAHQCLRSIPA